MSNKRMIDLHSHTTASDGTLSPDELVLLAHKAGIHTLAITDHDTMTGFLLAKNTSHKLGVRLIAGVEISCHHVLLGGYGKNPYTQKAIHVVGLDIQDVPLMQFALLDIQQSRASRGRAMSDRLASLFHLSADEFWADILTKTGGNAKSVGRVHLAQVLVQKSLVKTVQEAFDKYLAEGKPAYVAMQTLSMAQAVALIQDCGGKAVLAHPTRYKLSATRVRKLIADFAQMGGDGCELPAVSEPVSTRQMIDKAMMTCGLAVSVGSDFHGATTPWRRLGQVPQLTNNQTPIWSLFT